MKGKIPPQANDLEQIVLGAMMIDSSVVDEVLSIIKAKVFYKSQHQQIFEAIESIYHRSEAIDLVTVSDELKKQKKLSEIGGDYYLIQLTQLVSSSAHTEYHCRILLQKFIMRELIRNSSAVIEKAYDDGSDSLELLDNAYTHLNDVSNLLIKNKEIDIRELTVDLVEYGKKLFNNEIKPGIETPIRHLSEKMGGWRDGELIIIAARPGMGKTAFALKSAWHVALKKIPVAFFSLEMGANQLLSRLWSMDCKIENDKFIKSGLNEVEQNRVISRMNELEKIPLFIDDDTTLTIQSLSVKCKKWKKEKGIRMVVVDYLQLMEGGNKNREQEISKISRGLKLLAKELQIPVIALSQLSRSVEQRGGNKRPLLSDLRESGAIEQDADVVQFIYRPEYYNQDTWDDYNQAPCAGEAEYIIAKNRNGALVRNRMKFEGRFTNFSNIDDVEPMDDFIPPPPAPATTKQAFDQPSYQPDPDDEDDLPF